MDIYKDIYLSVDKFDKFEKFEFCLENFHRNVKIFWSKIWI